MLMPLWRRPALKLLSPGFCQVAVHRSPFVAFALFNLSQGLPILMVKASCHRPIVSAHPLMGSEEQMSWIKGVIDEHHKFQILFAQ
jgi:hypothetical protein